MKDKTASIAVVLACLLVVFGTVGVVWAAQSTIDGSLKVNGLEDDVQLEIEGHSTQTSNILEVETSASVNLFWVDNNGDVEMNGTTPTLTIGDAGEEDGGIVLDGAAQDFYMALDDSADDLILGLGSTVGTTGIVYLDENQDVGLGGASAGAKLDVTGNVLLDGAADEVQLAVQGYTTQTNKIFVVEETGATDLFWVDNSGDVEMNGTTPTLTIGDAGEEDSGVVLDGAAQDFYVALDDTADDLVIGLGSTVGTTPILALDENQKTTTGGDLTVAGTTPLVTVGDAGEEDAAIVYDGAAQDFYVALDDTADDLVIGLGSAVGTTPAISVDENQATTFSASMIQAIDVENVGSLPTIDSASVVTTATDGALWTVGASEIWFVWAVYCETTESFACDGDDCAMIIGDGNDTDGFLVLIDAEMQLTDAEFTGAPANWHGLHTDSMGAYLSGLAPFVYDGTDTIDVDVSGTNMSAGAATCYIVYTRVQ